MTTNMRRAASLLTAVVGLSAMLGCAGGLGTFSPNALGGLTVAGFRIGISPLTQTVTGTGGIEQAFYTITVTPTGGFSGSVGLSLNPSPGGVTGMHPSMEGSFDDTALAVSRAVGTTELTIDFNMDGDTPAGTYNFEVVGTSGDVTVRERASVEYVEGAE
ncbi:MAG: hypothetical protein HYU66_15345 [Armatimonadetes bacterium]|nr:hypothetical protein [Armatimonadota bacterium]